jgi:hypothetical protein
MPRNPKVRIVGVPPGEAPLWAREKWVGLELPLGRWTSPVRTPGFGVVSGPRSILSYIWALLLGRFEMVKGYMVPADEAVNILSESSPEAATWWRTNASQLLGPNRYFLFHEQACQFIQD